MALSFDEWQAALPNLSEADMRMLLSHLIPQLKRAIEMIETLQAQVSRSIDQTSKAISLSEKLLSK